MNVLIVDDEKPARDHLRHLLAAIADVTLVGEAEDGEQAIAMIRELTPDLVLLDIQMPGCSGFDVAGSLAPPRPKIIFCTAFDHYAVRAFEVEAVDYLLKPVHRARLASSLERVRRDAPDDAVLSNVIRSTQLVPNRFLAKRAGRYHVIRLQEVICFIGGGGLTSLRTASEQYWIEPGLCDLERRLSPDEFFRISRTAIVRLDAVKHVLPLVGGYGEITLTNGDSYAVSRRRFQGLLETLGISC